MSIDQALAACIAAVEQGMSVDECLAQYPQYAPDLEPILRLVARAHALQSPPMSDAAFARGRRRLAEAARAAQDARARQRLTRTVARRPWTRPQLMPRAATYRRENPASSSAPNSDLYRSLVIPAGLVDAPAPGGAHSVRSKPRQNAQPFFPNWPAALSAGIAVCLVFGAIWFSTLVGKSLPGSPLYTVKRGTEHVQGTLVTTLAPSSEMHAYWLAQQTEERLRELVALEALGQTVSSEWLAGIESQVETTLAVGMMLESEERVYFLDEWLATLRSLEQTASVVQAVPSSSLSGASPANPATHTIVVAAVSDVEQVLIQADLVVLAPTPTSTLSPDLPPTAEGVIAQSAAETGTVSNAADGSATGVADNAPASTGSAVAVAIAASPVPNSTSASDGADIGANHGADGESADTTAGVGTSLSQPQAAAEHSASGATAHQSAQGTESGGGANSSSEQTSGIRTPLPTATPRPTRIPAGALQPIPSPTPTWTPDPGTDNPTAIALAEVAREQAITPVAVTPVGADALSDASGRVENGEPGDEGGTLPLETEPETDIAGVAGPQLSWDGTDVVTATLTTTATPTLTVTLTPTLSQTLSPTLGPTHTPTPTVLPVIEDATPVDGTPDAPDHTPTADPVSAPDAESDAPNVDEPDATPTLIPTYTPSATPTATSLPAEPEPTSTPVSEPANGAPSTPAPTVTPTAMPTAPPTAPPTATPTLTPVVTQEPVSEATSVPSSSAADDFADTEPAHSRTNETETVEPTVTPSPVPADELASDAPAEDSEASAAVDADADPSTGEQTRE